MVAKNGCSVGGCVRQFIAKGLCRYHYEERNRGKLPATTIRQRGGGTLYEVPIPQTGMVGYYRDYKEPLTTLDGGYGYEGVLLYDVSMRKVQCHFCGEWFQSLGTHIIQHGLDGASYRKEYGLMKTTALIGEPMREHMIGQGNKLAERLMTDPVWQEKREEAMAKSRLRGKRMGAKASPEQKNKNGTCAAQLLAWLRANPDMPIHAAGSKSGPIVHTFGSWSRARRLAGLVVHNEPLDRTLALESMRTFAQHHGRAPFMSDARRELLAYSASAYARKFGSWRKAVVAAGLVPREKHTGSLQYAEYYQDWINRYEAGETSTEIAARYQCQPGTILKALRKRGITIRAQGRWGSGRIPR